MLQVQPTIKKFKKKAWHVSDTAIDPTCQLGLFGLTRGSLANDFFHLRRWVT